MNSLFCLIFILTLLTSWMMSVAPTYSTPLMFLHKVGLESSSTGSSFLTDSAKPVPVAMVLLESR